MNCSLLDSSVRGILQARILVWVALPSSRGSSQPWDWTQVSWIATDFYCLSRPGNPRVLAWVAYPISSKSNWTGVSCIAGGSIISSPTREAVAGWASVNGVPFLITYLEAPGKEAYILGLVFWVNQLFCLEQQASNLLGRGLILGKQTANSWKIKVKSFYLKGKWET